MHLMEPRTLGIVIMVLFCLLGVAMIFSPGSLRLERPEGGPITWGYNVANLLIILAVTPFVAVCLIKGLLGPLEATRIALGDGVLVRVVEGVGLALFAAGNALMCYCRLLMRRSFRLGGVAPRAEASVRGRPDSSRPGVSTGKGQSSTSGNGVSGRGARGRIALFRSAGTATLEIVGRVAR
ncbi:MAG: hypothetical protein KKI08_04050, partial [Armatimonadetes bacterium]|nr:hypothetical protein [Armatimonadota bacterium]